MASWYSGTYSDLHNTPIKILQTGELENLENDITFAPHLTFSGLDLMMLIQMYAPLSGMHTHILLHHRMPAGVYSISPYATPLVNNC